MWWTLIATLAAQSQPVLTYNNGVQPILARHCLSCHTAEGVAAAYPLETPEQVTAQADLIVDAVVDKRMPPWAPADDCNTYVGRRALTDDDIATLSNWAASGAAVGGMSGTPPVPPVERVRLSGDVVTTQPAEGYRPDVNVPDDYRCFVLDEEFDEETFITGYDFVPGVAALVHHAAVFLVPPAYLDDLAALDDAHPDQPGYPCFGGPGLDFVEYFGGWIPGTSAVTFPDDSAYVVPPGAKVVMQVHYNMAAGFTDVDQTGFQFITRDEAPAFRVKQQPMFNLDFVIDAGDAFSEHLKTTVQEDFSTWTAIGVLPHMHLLGEHLQLRVRHQTGDETCLLDVPDWDFELQESYFFEAPIDIVPGDRIDLTCQFNNSAANQPVVDGQQQAPREVVWGDGTYDEMCVAVITTLVPYGAAPEGTCVVDGDEGNALGVGRFCTDTGGQCNDLEADFCLGSAVADMPFCTKIYCSSDDECGEGATCIGNAAGSACIPDVCAGDGDGGCGCSTSSTSPSSSTLSGVVLGVVLGRLLRRRRRRRR